MAHREIAAFQIGVLGAGSWGTALAMLLADKGYPVTLWAYEAEVANEIAELAENRTYLPGIRLPENLRATTDMAAAVRDKAMVLFVTPSHVMRETARKAAGDIGRETLLVTASKGIENVTHKTMTGILQEEILHIPEDHLTVLSGPSFAREVGEKRPTVVTVAARNPEIARQVQEIFASPVFRVYTTEDVMGVEVGGAMKNVIAIAAGVVDGMELGLNTRAALITRGLAEIRRLGVAMGANPHTFSGLSGVGDLMLTCTGSLSRNHTVGQLLGQGKSLDAILKEMRMVAEGVKSARSVYNLSAKLGVELPICNEVYRVLYENSSPRDAVDRLMNRTLKQEFDDLI
ncbi:NAD(P)H-dependent glycerol-3-phosphate dehydrogenase [Desulfobotulus sp.]|jgi:glycerol-3-phosphate dehydrogenase (NAD(P)+)|uniref:NAD(P)H-dependent glycerol-3-phosphate dehydrogenase n=1 Tax=Desulfobotulus sp. TaxID=1940337 RepID=UPI002A360DCA|nr:NAD(P)H-dependent glycerol-3-phosphate dehydrogenase [Desulfobotulus sp.]MDY0164368.1 NAD(P)H-dependent glycerol-3-phosphate dehydrogenase [Desulfobotulus sp.]